MGKKKAITENEYNTVKPSLADRLYEAWEFAGNFGRRKHQNFRFLTCLGNYTKPKPDK